MARRGSSLEPVDGSGVPISERQLFEGEQRHRECVADPQDGECRLAVDEGHALEVAAGVDALRLAREQPLDLPEADSALVLPAQSAMPIFFSFYSHSLQFAV